MRRALQLVARHVAPRAQRARGAQHLERREIEHALRVRMIAVLRIVAGHEQEIADAEERGAEHVRLDGDAIPVARRDLHDGLEPAILQQARHRLRLHGHARARATR